MTYMLGSTLSPQTAMRCAYVASLQPVDKRLEALQLETMNKICRPQNASDVIASLHVLQRFELAGRLGVLHDPRLIDAMLDPHFITWNKYASMPTEAATEARKEHVARHLFKGDGKSYGSTIILAYDYTQGIMDKVLEECVRNGQKADVWVDDKPFERRLFHVLDEKGAQQHGQYWAERYEGFDRRILMMSNASSVALIDPEPDAAIKTISNDTFYDQRVKGAWATQGMMLSYALSPKDAEIDNIPYVEYTEILFKTMEIQSKELAAINAVFTEKIEPANIVHITNSDGTDVYYDISGRGNIGCHGDHNYPDGENFTAPNKLGTNGRVVAKGRYAPFMDDRIIENIDLTFQDGRIMEYSAEKGQEHLDKIINKDEGSHYLGEGPAFGTNYGLRRPVMNILLNEKTAGSYHFAIGKALYTCGEKVDNGNRSAMHFDITVMLANKDGMVETDREVIMKNGRYLDPRLAKLNPPE